MAGGDKTLNVQGSLVAKINDLRARVSELEAQQQVTILVRHETGSPSNGGVGQILVNTLDQNISMWADGSWRELTTW